MSLSDSNSINLSVLSLKKMGTFVQNWARCKIEQNPQTLCVLKVLGRKGGGSVVAAAKEKIFFIAPADLFYGNLPLQGNGIN